MTTKLRSETDGQWTVGQRVVMYNNPTISGEIAYVGPTDFREGTWIGVKLDTKSGRNNGSVQGKEYFRCESFHGLFVRPNHIFPESKHRRRTKSKESAKALQKKMAEGIGAGTDIQHGTEPSYASIADANHVQDLEHQHRVAKLLDAESILSTPPSPFSDGSTNIGSELLRSIFKRNEEQHADLALRSDVAQVKAEIRSLRDDFFGQAFRQGIADCVHKAVREVIANGAPCSPVQPVAEKVSDSSGTSNFVDVHEISEILGDNLSCCRAVLKSVGEIKGVLEGEYRLSNKEDGLVSRLENLRSEFAAADALTTATMDKISEDLVIVKDAVSEKKIRAAFHHSADGLDCAGEVEYQKVRSSQTISQVLEEIRRLAARGQTGAEIELSNLLRKASEIVEQMPAENGFVQAAEQTPVVEAIRAFTEDVLQELCAVKTALIKQNFQSPAHKQEQAIANAVAAADEAAKLIAATDTCGTEVSSQCSPEEFRKYISDFHQTVVLKLENIEVLLNSMNNFRTDVDGGLKDAAHQEVPETFRSRPEGHKAVESLSPPQFNANATTDKGIAVETAEKEREGWQCHLASIVAPIAMDSAPAPSWMSPLGCSQRANATQEDAHGFKPGTECPTTFADMRRELAAMTKPLQDRAAANRSTAVNAATCGGSTTYPVEPLGFIAPELQSSHLMQEPTAQLDNCYFNYGKPATKGTTQISQSPKHSHSSLFPCLSEAEQFRPTRWQLPTATEFAAMDRSTRPIWS